MTMLFDLILIAMAVYILVGGISGKGKLLKADNIKEGKEEEFKKISRIIYLVLGCTMLLHSLSTLVQNYLYVYDPDTQTFVASSSSGLANALSYGFLRVISIVFFALTIAVLVVLIILMRKYTDPEKVKQQGGAAQNERQKGHILPVDAFEFDEESGPEPEVSDEPETADEAEATAETDDHVWTEYKPAEDAGSAESEG